jgi:hypothetical protein
VVFSLCVSSESYLLSQGGKFSIGVFFEQDPLLSLSAKITFVTISFPSVLVVSSLCVSSEFYLLSQGGKSSFGTRVAMLRDVYCLKHTHNQDSSSSVEISANAVLGKL